MISPNRTIAVVLALGAVSLLGACATKPAFVDAPPTQPVSSYQVASSSKQFDGQNILWGGMVLEVKNFTNYSEVEILAYPLDNKQRPQLQDPDQGRFIALLPGFADPATLPKGRFVTLIGTVTGDRHAPLRGEDYVWPEINVKRMHLWPRDFREKKSRVSFGVGVGIGG